MRTNDAQNDPVGVRVIAGSLGGRRLVAPPGKDVRPTTDRIREALFNILGERVQAAHVLDLYCGSGAVAIEALSRGAESATLVDSAKASVAAANQNLTALGLSAAGRVVQSRVETYLVAGGPPRPADLIYIDPPYTATEIERAAAVTAILENGHLAKSGLIVVEQSSSDGEPPTNLGPLMVSGLRRYGASRLLFFETG